MYVISNRQEIIEAFNTHYILFCYLVFLNFFFPGERIMVETHIENSSSRALKLKFKLEQRQTFIAQSKQNCSIKAIFKAVEDPIPSRSKKTFTSRLKIPLNLDLTITNCKIIKVEYMLKVMMLYYFLNSTNIFKYVLSYFIHLCCISFIF